MIVIGVDPHMRTHTTIALDALTGASIAERTVSADCAGHGRGLPDARRGGLAAGVIG